MRSRSMSLVASALFLVLAPGTVAIYVPWLITRWTFGSAPATVDAVRSMGIVLILAGSGVLLDAFWRFAWLGRGSPAPILPPDALVISGLYRRVRNPMYVAVLCIILGQALWFWRADLLVYAACVAVAFDAFVRLYEEPNLIRRFGPQYTRYCAHVRRWLPRLRPWHPEHQERRT